MVLSNKKLKQKLRAAKAELLVNSVAKNLSINDESIKPGDPNSLTKESVKSLLESISQKPRFSKREKRREKKPPSQGITENVNGNAAERDETEGGKEVVDKLNEKKKKKKRKREEGEALESGGAEDVEVKEKKGKKKKKKKWKKKGKKEENGEVKEGTESMGKANGEGVKEANKGTESEQNLATKVYVGGIPYYSMEDDIRSYFEGCGSITEIDCMTFPESGKFRGIAIITFKTEAAARRALALDGSDMGGFFLKIQPYKSARNNKVSNFTPAFVEGYNRIYAGNLSWEITEDDLRKFFSGCNITAIRFGEDKETGEFRGYAHIDFADSLSLNMALKLDQKIICDRPVRISCAVAKKASVPQSKSIPENNQVDSSGADAVNSKIRRRTCYECGQRGHLSSSCPKKQETDESKTVPS